MKNVTKVGMADLNIAKHPDILVTLGLGSCVGVALYDSVGKLAGLAHIMLPYSFKSKKSNNPYKFADTAIIELIKKMTKAGANINRITAKLAGGAQMFSISDTNNLLNIGERNISACKEVLNHLKIPIISEDVGGNYGRTIEFYSEDGRLFIKTIGYGDKTI
ncbi:MAG: chemotaxis protein CheD [Clostridia bacterium]|nr:chemotaxis protein CheD [Clostridia bacterium]